MAVGDAHVFPGFLTPVLTERFFPKPSTTFLTYFCRGERRKCARKESSPELGIELKPPGHEFDTLTTEPPGRGVDEYRPVFPMSGKNSCYIAAQLYTNALARETVIVSPCLVGTYAYVVYRCVAFRYTFCLSCVCGLSHFVTKPIIIQCHILTH